jgi:hypothetical protein
MSQEPLPRETWQSSLRDVAGALGDVARAEVAVLREDVTRWGKRFGVAIALFAIAFMSLFWLMALLVYAAVRATESMLDFGPAQAALAVAGGVLAMILLMALIGFLLLRTVSGPAAAARARFADHRRWWRVQVLGEADSGEAGSGEAGPGEAGLGSAED